jgi:hypothetical protein
VLLLLLLLLLLPTLLLLLLLVRALLLLPPACLPCLVSCEHAAWAAWLVSKACCVLSSSCVLLVSNASVYSAALQKVRSSEHTLTTRSSVSHLPPCWSAGTPAAQKLRVLTHPARPSLH